jgi:hypothetical protein
MSRNLVRMLMAAVVLNSVVVGSMMAWPNTANSTGSQTSIGSGDFDYVFAAVAAAPHGDVTPANATMVDFDQSFASVSGPRRENTPPNRERLRNIGWKRILTPN